MRLLILGGGAVVSEFYLPALHILGKVSDVLVIEPSPTVIRDLTHRSPSLRCKQMGFQLGFLLVKATNRNG